MASEVAQWGQALSSCASHLDTLLATELVPPSSLTMSTQIRSLTAEEANILAEVKTFNKETNTESHETADSTTQGKQQVKKTGGKRKNKALDELDSCLKHCGDDKKLSQEVRIVKRRHADLTKRIQDLKKRKKQTMSPKSRQKKVMEEAQQRVVSTQGMQELCAEVEALQQQLAALQKNTSSTTIKSTDSVTTEALREQITAVEGKVTAAEAVLASKALELQAVEKELEDVNNASMAAPPAVDHVQDLRQQYDALVSTLEQRKVAKKTAVSENPTLQQAVDDITSAESKVAIATAEANRVHSEMNTFRSAVFKFLDAGSSPTHLMLSLLNKHNGVVPQAQLKAQVSAQLDPIQQARISTTMYQLIGKGLIVLDRTEPTNPQVKLAF